jgi:hypothetical protein
VRIEKAVYRLDEVWADAAIMQPPAPVVPYLAWQGRCTLFASAEKAGKSTLTGFVASAVSTGRDFLDEPCQRGTVLLVGLEEFIGDAGRRLREFRADPTRVYIADKLAGDPKARPQALRALIETTRPLLVVVDSLIAYSDGAVNDAGSSAQMGPLTQQFANLAHELDVAIVVIHHARKQDGKYRDSSAIGGAVDVICEMFAPEEDTDPTKRVLRAKGRVPTRDVAFHWTGTGYLKAGGPAVTPIEHRIVTYVWSNPGAGTREVRQHIGARGVDVDAAIERLIYAGKLVDNGTPTRRSLRATSATYLTADDSDRASTAPADPATAGRWATGRGPSASAA